MNEEDVLKKLADAIKATKDAAAAAFAFYSAVSAKAAATNANIYRNILAGCLRKEEQENEVQRLWL